MITPVNVLVLGILVPLGLFSPETLSFDRVSDFVTSWIGGIFTILTLALPMWHAMHRIHHTLHDFKIHAGNLGKVICYALAFLVSALAVIFVFMVK